MTSKRLPSKRIAIIVLILGMVSFIGFVIANVSLPQNKAAAIIHEFMVAMSNRDASTAYNLLATSEKENISMADFSQVLNDERFILFKDYQSVQVIGLRTNQNYSTLGIASPTAIVVGKIQYTNGEFRSFQAIMDKDAGIWKLRGIDIQLSEEEIQDQLDNI